MHIKAFEHILRASSSITGETIFIVLGSQAILAQFPDAPDEMLISQELDIYPKFRPDLADLIDGSIGEHSTFHSTFGYHADGVGPETAKLPFDWERRAINFEGQFFQAICPEIHDLACSKIIAGREKDMNWCRAAVKAGMLDIDTVVGLIEKVDVDSQLQNLARARIKRCRIDHSTPEP